MTLTAVSFLSDLVLSLRAGGHERGDLCLPISSHPSLVKLPVAKAEDGDSRSRVSPLEGCSAGPRQPG